ncbi:Hypothetical protein R9X50_00299400 [Acrodontium crateriforme]|uniref:SH3 domain-containing protein n=1 Tax=Acrodontium crateriforme TaxID=150365 RepID=A0AAQ3R3X0_9PEZI|nr:Hypothetical protein R9X50_00299400 [Acrodontium crateriforme]
MNVRSCCLAGNTHDQEARPRLPGRPCKRRCPTVHPRPPSLHLLRPGCCCLALPDHHHPRPTLLLVLVLDLDHDHDRSSSPLFIPIAGRPPWFCASRAHVLFVNASVLSLASTTSFSSTTARSVVPAFSRLRRISRTIAPPARQPSFAPLINSQSTARRHFPPHDCFAMGSHHNAAHERAHRRDTHSNKARMGAEYVKAAALPVDPAQLDVPGIKEQQRQVTATNVETAVDTVVNQVFITLTPTFSGEIAGWTTLSTPPATATTTRQPSHSPNFYTGDESTSSSLAQETSASPTASASSQYSSSQTLGTAAASATSDVTSAQSSNSADSSSTSSSSGMSVGASAGLAIGIIGVFALIAGLFFLCWRRRKNNKGAQEITDEKRRSSFISGGRALHSDDGDNVSTRSSRTSATAPRLSLRPVTQFLPNLNAVNSPAASIDTRNGQEQRPAQNPFTDLSAISEKGRPVSPPSNPFAESQGAVAVHQKSNSNGSNGAERQSPVQPPASPAMSAMSNVSGAAGPMARGPNNVHRVQLDFKPSMEDELELASGQLVRMLHEYDDGWALCVRMDRSQQGVCPRTCLSKLPVKPRPGPPPGQQRPQTPNSMRPSTPNSARMPPQGNHGPMFPRPLTPSQSRGPSPTNSGEMPDPYNRKPVPGQAL